MADASLLSRLQSLGLALEETSSASDVGGSSPLTLARNFLLTHLPQEPTLPYRADELLELLQPSPHHHWRWERERELVLEGLQMLQQLWLGRRH
jgi:hypothetical protein